MSDQVPRKHRETEDLIEPPDVDTSGKLRRSLSEGKIQQGVRTPPITTGKENIGTHFKNITTIVDCDVDKNLEDTDDEKVIMSPKQHPQRNPITGEGMEADDNSRSKLEDLTNANQEMALAQQDKKGPRRTCIRVRQPPGGKSSIVF